LRARGGFEVSMAWKDGQLLSAIIRSIVGTDCIVRYREQCAALNFKPRVVVRLNGSLVREAK